MYSARYRARPGEIRHAYVMEGVSTLVRIGAVGRYLFQGECERFFHFRKLFSGHLELSRAPRLASQARM